MHIERTVREVGIRLCLALITTGLLTTACSKEDPNDAAPATGTPTFTPPTGDAVLTASRGASVAYVGSAYFKDNIGLPVNAGDVSLNTLPLDTAYGLYSISSNNNAALDLSSGDVAWTVSGGNGFAAFSQDVNDIDFPDAGAINSDDTIHKSADYVFSWASVSGADYVTFTLEFTSKNVQGNTTSCTFTPAELSTLPMGTIFVSINACKYSQHTIGGKLCLFKKKHAEVRSLTVVN